MYLFFYCNLLNFEVVVIATSVVVAVLVLYCCCCRFVNAALKFVTLISHMPSSGHVLLTPELSKRDIAHRQQERDGESREGGREKKGSICLEYE